MGLFDFYDAKLACIVNTHNRKDRVFSYTINMVYEYLKAVINP